MLAERGVPLRLQPLQDRLLDHPVDDGRNAEHAFAPVRLGDSHPPHRLRTIAVLDKLARDLRPALFENGRQLLDGHAVNPRRSLVAHDRLRGRLDVLHVADRLHQAVRPRRAFVPERRHGRFGFCRPRARGFTPAGLRQVQLQLDWQPLRGHETRVLFALSFNPKGTVRAFAGSPDYYALC